MNPRMLIKEAAGRLQAAGIPDPAVDAGLLLSHLTGKPALSLRLDMDTVLDDATLAAYEQLIARRLTREPLQYILGGQPFLGRMFQVDARVLIPRPETELLAEKAITALRETPAPATVLDLCCGSGCLGISLALEVPGSRVHAADLSPDALAVTQQNADNLQAALTLHQGDLWQAVEGLTFDVIVSNPPYIPSLDCRELQPEVLQEPLMALDGGQDGLNFYRRIAHRTLDFLRPGGMLLLEVGMGEAQAVAQLLQQAGLRQVTISP